ncbi:MAG TPA: Rieske (2Fe-2S) protein [Candidatus Acidoferrales bacterium]|nr:Rieske (2Fe-2S) protein [Candidatus Acidoferrales bacterium]
MNSRERAIAGALIVAMFGSLGFVAAYATGGDRLYEGIALAAAFGGLCATAIGWAFWIVPDEQVADAIEEYPSPPEVRGALAGELRTDLREVSRPRALVRLLYVAAGCVVAALLVPIRSLGPNDQGRLFHTRWKRGDRLVREDGSAVRAADLNVGSIVTVFPEGWLGDAQSQAALIRVPSDTPGTAQGYLAYSRVCTHAGCPVALYRASAKQLLCPCHQSVFDVLRDGAVVSGPADHALPRLPIEVAADGTLRALGDFPVPVGPGFWERA